MDSKGESSVLAPRIHESVYVAEGARIFGDVEIGPNASVWFNAVIRGDEGKVIIGEGTNVQDNAVLHSDMGSSVEIGKNVTIGHGAVLRGCRIGENAMIGMNATIMTHAVIGEHGIVGANSFVPRNRRYEARSMIMGSPAKRTRELTEEELGWNEIALGVYRGLVDQYLRKEILGFRRS
jgi:carbonic anhydrase/acetyltransferase-like protein (isoleucine patch superfamily)